MKIQNKLFLFLFGFSLTLVTVLILLMQWSIGKGMVEYVIFKEIDTLKPVLINLSKEYQKENNWRSMTDNHPQFRQLISQQLTGSDFEPKQRKRRPEHRRLKIIGHRPAHSPDPMSDHLSEQRPEHKPEHRPPPKNFAKRPPPASEAHYALLDIDNNLVVGNYLKTLEYVKTPIKSNNQVIGYFAISKRNQLTQGYEVDFIKQQQHYLWFIGVIVMLLVALVTLPLARHVVEPIKRIAQGMHKLTQGDYQQSIELNRQDELSELSRDYNELALTLAENETARKRWLANISHELRTPVAILRGELEAMLDKVRPITENNIASANDEVKHLQRLIDDLNLLTSADIGGMCYRKQPEELISLIQSEAEKYRGYLAGAGIELALEISAQQIHIYADKNRLFQLFENIINNAIKYSSATQFTLSVTLDKLSTNLAEKSQASVTITLADNGVGVDEEHLEQLFEHLYRVEDSRNRKTGGSGLGLSICRHIVTAHQGVIIAHKAGLGGLAVKITLPLS